MLGFDHYEAEMTALMFQALNYSYGEYNVVYRNIVMTQNPDYRVYFRILVP